MKYLLDTNVVSHYTKPRPNLNVMQKLNDLKGQYSIAAPVILEAQYGYLKCPANSKMELPDGTIVDRKPMLKDYVDMLLTLPIYDYDKNVALYHADYQDKLNKNPRLPEFADTVIALIALANNLILVTHNTADFQVFNDVCGLKMEDWEI